MHRDGLPCGTQQRAWRCSCAGCLGEVFPTVTIPQRHRSRFDPVSVGLPRCAVSLQFPALCLESFHREAAGSLQPFPSAPSAWSIFTAFTTRLHLYHRPTTGTRRVPRAARGRSGPNAAASGWASRTISAHGSASRRSPQRPARGPGRRRLRGRRRGRR